MTRFSRHFEVVIVEEPMFDANADRLDSSAVGDNLTVVVPHLRKELAQAERDAALKALLHGFFRERNIDRYLFWFYTPMMLPVVEGLEPELVVYDCVEEFSSLKHVPLQLRERENALFAKADLVFTAGHSLYEHKKQRHRDVHPFPSSIDTEHFFKARLYTVDPEDQATIPHPRIGFFGVIDERIDLSLIEGVARRKPEWHLIMVGPVNIDKDHLPKLPNIHYLGKKAYEELPAYISSWDIAMMPFAHNESTRYISPTKTPEYLAAGRPVISTPITDVLRQYGRNRLVQIAGTPEEFVRVATLELENYDRDEWLEHVNEFLAQNSWDKTWHRMMFLITKRLNDKQQLETPLGEQVHA